MKAAHHSFSQENNINTSSEQDSIRKVKAQMRSGVLSLPSYTRFRIRNHFLAVHSVIARIVVLVVTWFSNPLTVTISSDLSTVTNSVPKISGLDCDTFTLVRAKVPNFRDHFRFSLEIFSLTSLSYFRFCTWCHPVFFLLSLTFILFNDKK